MIEIKVNGSVVSNQETEALYSGSADTHLCHFTFDADWDSFSKSAVFRVGGKAVTAVIDEESCCVLPWELLTRANIGRIIEVGVYGVSAEAEVLTTVWDDIGAVRDGSEIGNDAREPSEGVYEQVMAGIQRLDEKVVSYNEQAQTKVQRAESAAAVAQTKATEAINSATAAAIASKNAESALAGVRSALDNLPAGDTLIVNDLTTGGAGAALSAEMGRVLGQRPNPSLLHNAYFLNAVNQRGQTEYSGTGYTADRWSIRKASGTDAFSCTTAISDWGVTVTNSSASISAFFTQLFDDTLPAGTYTLSVLVTEVTGAVYMSLYTTSGTYDKRVAVTEPGIISLTVTVAAGRQKSFRITVSSGASVTIAAAKLELGSEQTLAHQDASGNWVLNEIPDHGEELAKCQRYYQLFSGEDARPTALADYRPAMRATPQTGTIDINGVTHYYADANL